MNFFIILADESSKAEEQKAREKYKNTYVKIFLEDYKYEFTFKVAMFEVMLIMVYVKVIAYANEHQKT